MIAHKPIRTARTVITTISSISETPRRASRFRTIIATASLARSRW